MWKLNCDAYDLMTASLQEATDKYHNWLNAQNASQSGDMFDDTLDAINRIKKTLNDTDSEYYGRVGRTDYQAALNLIIPDTINSEDEAKVNAYLNSIYSMFTYDDNGNRAGLNIELPLLSLQNQLLPLNHRLLSRNQHNLLKRK